ncbi:MAG TPA: formate/nitrite transporter family protein [Pseudogracilibacillus sp.]|nr:formate/nitrite transporter family protein [Pseudogracilibacillus sp.]
MNNSNKQDKRSISEHPKRNFFLPAQIISVFAKGGEEHLNRSGRAKLLLAVNAGAFMAFGATFSILLAIGIQIDSLEYLLSGFGFATGYVMVFLSGAILFTEVNVLLPTYYLQYPYWLQTRFLRFWGLTYIGNMAGAFLTALIIWNSSSLPSSFVPQLNDFLDNKMMFMQDGVRGWFKVLLSGVIANWLIGMASFFTIAARDIIGKIVGTFLPVTLFVAGNFQHSAANMGYFSLGLLMNQEYTWDQYLFLNLLPASIGNIIGGGILIALLFSYAFEDELPKK